MEYLFKPKIDGWKSWREISQSIDVFQGLIKEIFLIEKLIGYENISNLTPATNAVFKVSNYVIKIFAPQESGLNTKLDYTKELEAMSRAIRVGTKTPNIVGASNILDKYLFRYIIMDYIIGKDAGIILKNYSVHQKIGFAQKLKGNMAMLNVKPVGYYDNNFIKDRAIDNERWDEYSKVVRQQIRDIVSNYNLSQSVYVHGDLTANNIIIDENEDFYIIDFAESVIAPAEYEYASIVFDLFNSDIIMVNEYFADIKYDIFIEKLFHSLLLGDFGGNLVKHIYENYSGKNISELKDIYEIRTIIYCKFFRENR